MPLFQWKSANSGAGDQKTKLSEREKLLVGGVIAAALVVVAAFTLIASGGGTPLSRCRGVVLSQQRYSCLEQLANSTSNASVCSYLPGIYQAGCVSGVAARTGNLSVCSQVESNESYYSACIFGVSNSTVSASECGLLADPYKSECLYNIASKENFTNAEICSGISNTTLNSDCTDKADYNYAVKNGDLGYCAMLPNTQNYSLISYMVGNGAASVLNFSSPLAFINSTPQQYCRYRIAKLTYNESACAGLGGYLSLICSSNFQSLQTTSGASKITLQNVSSLCASTPSFASTLCAYAIYTYIAVANENASICKSIGLPASQYGCYAGIALRYKNSTYCSYIGNTTARVSCLATTANSTA